MFEMSEWEARALFFFTIVGTVVCLIGIPVGLIYGIWWLIHHVRFV